MPMVGWDAEESYNPEELEAFASKAMKKMKELGSDSREELARYGNRTG